MHPLEHGRIEVQYKAGTDETVGRLEALLAEEQEGYHMLMFQNTTNMPMRWPRPPGHTLLACPSMNDKVFDAIRTFRAGYTDKGPENVP